MNTILRTEIKLLLRHWGVWIVLAATVLLGYDVGRQNTMGTLPHWIDESVFRFFLLGPLLLTVSAGRRARADRVDELLEAMPYAAGRWVLGRYFANWLVWLLFSLACWLVPVLFLLLRGEGVGAGTLALHWLAAAPVSVAVTTAVGFALGHLPGSSIPGYLAAMTYYFASVFVPLFTSRDAGIPWMFMDFLAPQRYLPLTATGYFPNTGLVLLNRGFAVSLAAGLGAFTVLLLARRRRLPVLLAGLILALSLATAGASAAGTHAVLTGRETARAEEAAAMSRAATPKATGQVNVDHYDLSVRFDPARHGLSVTGRFTVTNPGVQPVEQIDLTLRANLSVDRVRGADGAEIPFERVGNRLTLKHRLRPGETVTVSADWRGTVWHWRNDRNRNFEGWSLGAHVAPASIFLPATYGWYPIAGDVRLYWATDDHRIWDLTPQQPAAEFKLATAGTDLSVVTNAGARAPGLYMVGTSLPTTVVDGIAYTVAPATLQHAVAVVKDLRPRADMLGHREAPLRVIEVPEGVDLGLEVASELRVTPGAVLLHTQDAEWGTALDNIDTLAYRWWNRSLTFSGVGQGLGAYMEWVLTGDPKPFGSEAAEVMEAMIALDETKGRPAAMALLHALYGSPAVPTYAEFAAAFHEAAAGEGRLRHFMRGAP